jgi:hypothetical protein
MSQHLLASNPDEPRRTTRPPAVACPFCAATPGGCRALHWLKGQTCCEECSGDHGGVSR